MIKRIPQSEIAQSKPRLSIFLSNIHHGLDVTKFRGVFYITYSNSYYVKKRWNNGVTKITDLSLKEWKELGLKLLASKKEANP